MMALSNEWSPALCGSEAKEVFGCLSWMGRQSTTRLVKHLTKHMDIWTADNGYYHVLEVSKGCTEIMIDNTCSVWPDWTVQTNPHNHLTIHSWFSHSQERIVKMIDGVNVSSLLLAIVVNVVCDVVSDSSGKVEEVVRVNVDVVPYCCQLLSCCCCCCCLKFSFDCCCC